MLMKRKMLTLQDNMQNDPQLDRLTSEEMGITPPAGEQKHFDWLLGEYEAALECEDEGWIADVVSEFRKAFGNLNSSRHSSTDDQPKACHRLGRLAGKRSCLGRKR